MKSFIQYTVGLVSRIIQALYISHHSLAFYVFYSQLMNKCYLSDIIFLYLYIYCMNNGLSIS